MLREATTASIRVESVDSVREVPQPEWERVTAHASFFQTRPYLEAVELDDSIPARYLLARDEEGRLLGVLPTYLWSGGPIFGDYDFFSLFVRRADRSADPGRWLPALLLGGRAGYLNDLLVAQSLPHTRRLAVLRALLAAAGEYAQAVAARSMAFLYLRRPALAGVLEALPDRALVLLTAAHARIDLPSREEGFDGYLRGLTKSGRWTVRQELRRFEESGLEVSVEPLGRWYRRCAPLLANVQNRYGHDDDAELLTEVLARRAATADDATRTFVGRRGDDLVGFALYYENANGLYSGGCGFDYGLRRDSGAYFALVYYRPIAHALRAGLPAVHAGLGAYEAKLIRGATLESLWSVIFRSEAVPEVAPLLADWNAGCREIFETRFGRFRKAFANDTWDFLQADAAGPAGASA